MCAATAHYLDLALWLLYAHTMGTRQLKANLPTDLADYADDLMRSLGCSSPTTLAEAFLRLHQDRPVEGLAVYVAKVESRIAAAKTARGKATMRTNRAKRWPADRK
jgi:hypothetical protein